ncbi:M28 family peptidase [Carnobacterium mobile]|uniref:M28 family peptidase n=1 Tax=Carnobacterium mobile TaxID=2750 RepID=UPI000B282301|nr:M28 family peptidase [Carnobacterium mobile]
MRRWLSTLFGRKEGKLKDAPVVMIGSHYDSVVNSGAFDGAAGVTSALETIIAGKQLNR